MTKLKMLRTLLATLGVCTVAVAHGTSPHQDSRAPSFAASLLSVEGLPRFRPVARVGAFTSYDRTGGNDDGFSGKYSFLRKEGDGLVIAEVAGPGAITRIHFPTPFEGPLEFYFDGERTPRLSLSFYELFAGDRPPFLSPLIGHGAGGYYSYVPLEFAKSIKVVVRSERFLFYQINYAVYEPAVAARTFTPSDRFLPPDIPTGGNRLSGERTLAPGQSVTLWETRKPGRIQLLQLSPAGAFAGGARDLLLRIYWDGAERAAVDVPVADFFGYSFGQPATRSLLFGTDESGNYNLFPMPFARAARIELVSERRTSEPVHVRWELVVSDRGKTADEGYFHATWRRENPTVDGQPFTYLDVTGRGQLVAAILQAQGREVGRTWFFEGDDEAIIDGAVAVHGVGSEDAFNGGWYDIPGRWNQRVSLPFSGCLEYNKATARTGGYRVFIGDAYSFKHSLRHTIEHGGENNSIPTDYTGTSFFYLDRPAGTSSLAAADRTVTEPGSFVLEFSPSPPPIASLLSASLKVTRAREGADGFVSFRADLGDADVPHAQPATGSDFEGPFGPPTLALSVEVPAPGRYSVLVDALTGPDAAMLELRVNDEAVGNAVDFYSSTPGRSGPQKLAELTFTESKNLLFLTLPGRNANSSGIGVDLVRIRGDRLP